MNSDPATNITSAIEALRTALAADPALERALRGVLAGIDDVSLDAVAEAWGLTRGSLLARARRDPTFPRPVRVGNGRYVVSRSALMEWRSRQHRIQTDSDSALRRGVVRRTGLRWREGA